MLKYFLDFKKKFLHAHPDFAFLDWFFMTVMYENLVSKGFFAGCTIIARLNFTVRELAVNC